MSRKCVRTKADGTPCTKWAVKGATVCEKHGGNAPQVRARAAVRAEVEAWGLGDTTVDPGETLLRLLSQAVVRAERYASAVQRIVEEQGLEKALVGDTSVAIFWSRIGIAYRTDVVTRKPTSWKDLGDETYAGRRGTYVIGNTLGINFLFMTSKIYGKDFFDVDAGIAAIKRMQPKLVDFTGTIEKYLESKEVVIAVLHDGSTYDLQKRGIPLDWAAPSEGVPILDQVIQVTKGSKNKELAWKLVDAYLSPEVQTAFATELFFSPTNKTVKLPPEVARKIISGPADVDKLVLFDWAKIARQRPQWTERWNKELR